MMKKNIVILDDDLMSLRSLANTLKEWGYRPACFSDYNKQLKNFDFTDIKCLITDYHLRNINGLTVICEIKRLYPQLKCILISGYTTNEYGLFNDNTYLDSFFPKPINIKQLSELLSKINMEEK